MQVLLGLLNQAGELHIGHPWSTGRAHRPQIVWSIRRGFWPSHTLQAPEIYGPIQRRNGVLSLNDQIQLNRHALKVTTKRGKEWYVHQDAPVVYPNENNLTMYVSISSVGSPLILMILLYTESQLLWVYGYTRNIMPIFLVTWDSIRLGIRVKFSFTYLLTPLETATPITFGERKGTRIVPVGFASKSLTISENDIYLRVQVPVCSHW